MKPKKYTKLQIIEAAQGLARVLAAEVDNPDLDSLDSHVRDIIAILEGELTPPTALATPMLDIPGFGRIPLLGEIDNTPDGDNRVLWYNGNDFHPEQTTPPKKCPKCKTLTGTVDIDGDTTCSTCGLVLSFADSEAML